MKLSVIYLSHRPGSIDILRDTLAKQQAGPEWELIVVDGCPGRVERGHARAYLEEAGLPLAHYVPPKPKTFPWSRTGFVNAMNTGMLHTSGSHVLFVHDFMRFPEDSFFKWGVLLRDNPKYFFMAPAVTCITREPDVIDDVWTWHKAPAPIWEPLEPWVPEVFDLGLWGGPIELFDKCNGIDERADFCSEWALDCVLYQGNQHGYKFHVHRQLNCHMLDHRRWHKETDKDGVYRTFGNEAVLVFRFW